MEDGDEEVRAGRAERIRMETGQKTVKGHFVKRTKGRNPLDKPKGDGKEYIYIKRTRMYERRQRSQMEDVVPVMS